MANNIADHEDNIGSASVNLGYNKDEDSTVIISDDSMADCCICMDNVASVITLPCQHNVLCINCAFVVKRKPCPICRTKIEKMVIKKELISDQVVIEIDKTFKPKSTSEPGRDTQINGGNTFNDVVIENNGKLNCIKIILFFGCIFGLFLTILFIW